MTKAIQNQHIIEISCESSAPGVRTSTPVQLITEGDGSLHHWLSSFRSALVAFGFDAQTASRLKIEAVIPEDEMKAMKQAVQDPASHITASTLKPSTANLPRYP